ncbi:GTPase IMAP family member 8 [Anabarilius grahami]|uniref:GTPase IMAP family member 8 n=1 Tax=Anabarilius grahami TaxID=495550 RepID=A0A3N0YJX8_ANAGA|nr:GTPase IMAP family member 8 [Anabarilius grahami]
MVLLGYNGSGKSSTGNTILGKSAFGCKRSLTSVIREGDVAGRHITVVDTPGRRRNYHTKYTPRLYKDELVLSPSHCPPGPHVFLLVIRVDVSFTEVYRRAVEQHIAYLGADVWDHIIVLFTFGDWLRDTSIELFIESEGEALQWIIDKCGNRYHVFNNKNKDDDNQMTELLEKIEVMVAGNKGCCFERNNQNLQEVKNRRMKVKERANQMRGEVQERNELRHSTSGFEKDYLFGKRLEDAKLNILRSVTECSYGTHAFILVLSVESSFAEEEKSGLEKIMEPLGENVWKHTLVVFAVGDELGDTPIELFIASEGDALQWLIEKCGKKYHVLNNKNWGDGSQVTELLEKIEEMVAENRECLYELDEETLERVQRIVAIPIKRAQSMDDPLYLAEECSPSSGISSAYVSKRSQEGPEERHFMSSSKRSSGVESLGSIPDFD